MSHSPPIADVPAQVDALLESALARHASDLHLDPQPGSFALRLRIDGLLEPARIVDSEIGAAMVTRLMVMADLLTYRRDLPQEGRITLASPASAKAVELRVSVIPTTQGLRAVVRLPAELTTRRSLEDLGLPPRVLDELKRFACADQGLLLVTGPAGAGKTTTIYALLRHIVATQSGLSLVTIEDPVESQLPGVAQIQVSDTGPLDYAAALRSVLRQDPQVLMLGEIRDAATASIAVQAALSGHRLIATMHAGSPAAAIARLLEMGVEPYQVTSSVEAVLTQRLLRRKNPDGGYFGRLPIAELARMTLPLRIAIASRADASALAQIITAQSGHQTLLDAARDAVAAGLTDATEVQRALPQN